jgi:hypothetical protein
MLKSSFASRTSKNMWDKVERQITIGTKEKHGNEIVSLQASTATLSQSRLPLSPAQSH